MKKKVALLIALALLLAGCDCDWQKTSCPIQQAEKMLISR
ncbi:hypothetical protein ANAEL_00754 [Anaerolineales bacterium]|nr:hypothetical protein ANAEL_00754 [Anaerolineales bacterium]